MPHINAQQVKIIRQQIKQAFPQFKVSVTRDGYSGVSVAFMEGPIALGLESYEQIPRDIGSIWVDREKVDRCPVATRILERASEIAHQMRTPGRMDSDYGYVPSYYVNIAIGKWDQEYTIKARPVIIK